MAKRIVIVAYDAMAVLACALILALAPVSQAHAYIDPSVMTYTIQAVAGVVVALSAVAGVALRRGRKALMRVLDIDENSKKQFEADVHRTDGNAAAGWRVGSAAGAGAYTWASDAESKAGTEKPAAESESADPAKNRKKGHKPLWKERLVYALIAAFFFTFTIYFVAPLEIVAGASQDLVYSMGDVWWTLLLPDLAIIAGITLVLTLLRGKAFNIGLVLVFAVGLCAYVQALFLNAGLPAANGDTIAWADHMPMQIISTIVWLVIIAAALVFGILRSRRSQGVVAIAAVCLVIVQGVGLISLAFTPAASGVSEASDAKVVMTEDQMYTVNPNHNVVVFILDTYDTAYLKRILRDFNPDLLEGFDGFTNYENATSAMIPTRFAIPEMLTGQMPSFDETYETYASERYERSDFLQNIYDANYSIGLYTDSMRISALPADEQRSITSKTVNIHSLPDSMMDYWGCVYSLFQMGQYRDVLWPFKWAFWYYTDQINRAMVASDEATAPDETIYVMDDVRYYNRLSEFGLTLEDGDYDGAFRFIHLLGSHYPFSYDEEANFIGDDESNVFRQSQGALHIMKTYIAKLKELGVYENTTIIITADHGYWTITLDPIEETSTPIMFVKPEQSAELDAQPMVTNEKPVSHLDLQATILDAMGLDYSEYSQRDEWAGYSMFGYIDPDRVRYYLTTDSLEDLTAVQFREYEIDGNALDWENWHETGRFIEPIEQE
ncbi:MAG: sulfatase-like hydrolase/transferase [Eggerthellaceae bacterium]|nr:sulfatase-like hydrolase/transferase [Eggerthellaceae bacterium]